MDRTQTMHTTAATVVYSQLPSTDDSIHSQHQYPPFQGHQKSSGVTPSETNLSYGLGMNPSHSSDTLSQYPTTTRRSIPRVRPSNSGMTQIWSQTALVLALSIVLPFMFFVYIFGNRTSWSISALQTTVPLGTVLLLFSILSKIIISIIPLIMSITAFHTAGTWLQRQKLGRDDAGVSPYQYNLLLDIYTGSSFFSMWRTLLYLLRPSTKSKKRHTRRNLSYILVASITALVAVLIVAYTIAGIDFALHHLSIPVLVQKQVHRDDSKAASYGRQLKSECLVRNPNNGGAPCTIIFEQPLGSDSRVVAEMDRIYVSDYPEALRVASGTSDINKVIVANDGQHQVATLVPANPAVTTGSSYEAQTSSIQLLPKRLPQVEGGFNKLQPKSELFTQFTDHRPWFRRGLSYNGTDTNPYTFWFYGSMHTESQPAEGERNQVWVQDPDTQISYSMLMCKATVVDVTVQYTAVSDSYSITSSVPSANNATIRAVTAVLNMGQSPIDAFVSVMQPIALSVRTGEEFVRSFEMQFAKMSLPFAQVAFEPIPAIRSNLVETVRGSSIPTPWLLAYVGMLSLFGLFALLQGSLALRVDKTSVWRPNEEKDGKRRRRLVGLSPATSFSSNSEGTWVNVTQLAAERLTAPTALVFEALERQSGDPDSQIRSLQPDGLEMFRESRRGGEPSCTVGIGFWNEGLEAEKRDNPFGLVIILPTDYALDSSQSPIASDEEIGRAI